MPQTTKQTLQQWDSLFSCKPQAVFRWEGWIIWGSRCRCWWWWWGCHQWDVVAVWTLDGEDDGSNCFPLLVLPTRAQSHVATRQSYFSNSDRSIKIVNFIIVLTIRSIITAGGIRGRQEREFLGGRVAARCCHGFSRGKLLLCCGKMYLFKLQNTVVQISKCIFGNC